jgi:hypothetical protein
MRRRRRPRRRRRRPDRDACRPRRITRSARGRQGAGGCGVAATRVRHRGAFRTFSPEELRRQATTAARSGSSVRRDRLSNESFGFDATDRFRIITMNRARSVSSAPVDETDMARGAPQQPRRKRASTSLASQGSQPWIAGSFSMSLARATVNLSAARARSLRGGDLRVPRRTVAVKSRRAVANTVSEMNKVRLRARPRAIDRPRDETKSLPRTPSPAVPNVDDAVP